MRPTSTSLVTSLAELDAWIEREGIRFFKIGVFDIDGVMRGKYVDRAKLDSAVDKGFGFCDVVLGWDLHDQLYDRASKSPAGTRAIAMRPFDSTSRRCAACRGRRTRCCSSAASRATTRRSVPAAC